MKQRPPFRSVVVMAEFLSFDLACPPTPPAKMPKPMMMALAIRRMIRLVMLRVKTSEVEEALAKNCRAFSMSGESDMLDCSKRRKRKILNQKNFFN